MIRFWALLAFTALAVLGAPLNACAQDAGTSAAPLLMLRQNAPTHPERILMAYHKLAGTEPDFQSWGQKSPYLRTAVASDRDAIINREINRLQQAWSAFDVNEPIVVHTVIHLDDYSTLQEVLTLSEFTTKTFFSFSMYDENIAIVPKGIADFNKIAITKSEMDEMLKKTAGGQIMAELLLKPVEADSKTPFVQNGTSYWLMLADIGEIRFWTDKGGAGGSELLWMKRAAWFKPKEDKALMDLKGGL